jgi:PKD repeat protein
MLKRLDCGPAPVADFFCSPADPSTFDRVQFSDSSYDPAQAGIETASWDLGDSATAIGSSPSHGYAADGEYRVRLTVTTTDGRSASIARIVSVRTHDVAIVRLDVPRSAMEGETHVISVVVTSSRYPETVQVELFRNSEVTPIARLIQAQPAREAASFDFAYTFTGEDATAGTVTFKALATIVGARDAQPTDNAAFAPPTKILPPAA